MMLPRMLLLMLPPLAFSCCSLPFRARCCFSFSLVYITLMLISADAAAFRYFLSRHIALLLFLRHICRHAAISRYRFSC